MVKLEQRDLDVWRRRWRERESVWARGAKGPWFRRQRWEVEVGLENMLKDLAEGPSDKEDQETRVY